MFKKGLLEEVKELLQKGYSLELPAMSGLGYKQVGEFLVNKSKTFAEVVLDIKLKTRQYAKRQMTWFKRDKEIHWVKNYEEAEKLVKEFVQKVS
jgi:tRNA dimethylallyltransferase